MAVLPAKWELLKSLTCSSQHPGPEVPASFLASLLNGVWSPNSRHGRPTVHVPMIFVYWSWCNSHTGVEINTKDPRWTGLRSFHHLWGLWPGVLLDSHLWLVVQLPGHLSSYWSTLLTYGNRLCLLILWALPVSQHVITCTMVGLPWVGSSPPAVTWKTKR